MAVHGARREPEDHPVQEEDRMVIRGFFKVQG